MLRWFHDKRNTDSWKLGMTTKIWAASALLADGWADSAEITIGDAIDDLADIYSELLDVAWCLQHTNADDATRLFRFGFSHHWGRHVCDVRGAVHYELFGM